MTTDDIVNGLTAQPDIEGVTLLGGEPFDQASGLADVAERCSESGLGVITFTGHYLAALRTSTDTGTQRLLAATDLLIDGPYEDWNLDTGRPLVGSTNQGFHCLTPRYQAWCAGLADEPDRLELRITATGQVHVSGWAPDGTRQELTDLLGRRAPRP